MSRRSNNIVALKARPGAATSRPARGVLHTLGGEVPTVWQVPEEVPVALLFNSQNYAVMMATPADLEDFAVGFALAEGLVARASDIGGVLVLPTAEGLAVDLAVAEAHLNRGRMARRSLEGRAGCGLCGIEDIRDAIRMPGHRVPDVPLSAQAVARAYAELPRHQPMNEVNRTVHAAAWCSVDGEILLAREDVGRHNALDKLIGALARTDTGHGAGLRSHVQPLQFRTRTEMRHRRHRRPGHGFRSHRPGADARAPGPSEACRPVTARRDDF